MQLIDPYWTIAPVLIGNAYRSSLLPSSSQGNARQLVSLTLLWAWSTRLTYSYFRRSAVFPNGSCTPQYPQLPPLRAHAPLLRMHVCREKWRVGAREDWRYEDMRAQYGPHWWWVSFFVVFLIQQVQHGPACACHSCTPLGCTCTVLRLLRISGTTCQVFEAVLSQIA